MRERERVQRRQCPQCGWDAEGRRVDGQENPAGPRTRYDPAPERDYECGNCGYRWTE
jgi:hypothetical protein